MMRRIAVRVEPHPYEVLVGAGALAQVPAVVGERRRVAVVSEAELAPTHAARVVDGLRSASLDAWLVPMDSGETAKSMTEAEGLCRAFARAGLLRGDAVVAVGGGVVGDTAGFAASIYHRGIDLVHVPTTLLAQVDSSIGGKTGVNLPEGKNLVGSFHQPVGVVADPDTLATLSDREFRAGLGEVAKYALMGVDDVLPELLARSGGARRDPAVLTELVARCVAIKAALVAADPQERTGARSALNYGHTLAHALEVASDFELSHGEAVGVGLVFAAELAGALGRIEPAAVNRHREVVAAAGLPTSVPLAVAATELVELMRRDKKAAGGLTFVLAGPQGVERVDDPPAPALEAALAAVGVTG